MGGFLSLGGVGLSLKKANVETKKRKKTLSQEVIAKETKIKVFFFFLTASPFHSPPGRVHDDT